MQIGKPPREQNRSHSEMILKSMGPVYELESVPIREPLTGIQPRSTGPYLKLSRDSRTESKSKKIFGGYN